MLAREFIFERKRSFLDILYWRLCYIESMSEGKIGGYESNLTPRAKQKLQSNLNYERGWDAGERDARPEDVRLREELAASIDVQKLEQVFIQYLTKSGVPAANINRSGVEKMVTRPMKDASASYTAFTNRIALSTKDETFISAKQFSEKGGHLPQSLLMKVQLFLIHEICHAFSVIRLSAEDIEGTENVILKEDVGYAKKESVLGEAGETPPEQPSAKRLEAFNEGVTQRVAEEIFVEYAKQTGARKGLDELEKYIRDQSKNLWQYSIYGNQIDTMCERIGEYVGVPKKVVWDAIKRGYFENPRLFEEETAELFKETFGENFLDRYATMENNTPVKDLGRFDGDYKIPHPEGYADRWLKHLAIKPE